MMFNRRYIAATIGFAIGLIASGTAASARPTVAEMICTNPASGATWPIEIDFDRHMVDSYSAQISDSEIVWHDPKAGGTYTLFRRTGELRFIGPSSTGGYSIFDRCVPAKSN
jgi:hypothetical protein